VSPLVKSRKKWDLVLREKKISWAEIHQALFSQLQREHSLNLNLDRITFELVTAGLVTDGLVFYIAHSLIQSEICCKINCKKMFEIVQDNIVLF
jgi:hypothetical protein